MKRYLAIGIGMLVVVMIVVPTIFVMLGSNEDASEVSQVFDMNTAKEKAPPLDEIPNQLKVSVYRTKQKKVETLKLEPYVAGVVAAEMPADFELEALKAQALAARTYIIRRLAENDFSDVPQGAHVTDTIRHQVYLDDAQLKRRWGVDYRWKKEKIHYAVAETSGKVLTYQGKPINATFFSTSNGYTENSEEYWLQEIPYLRSTSSPWDTQSPKFTEQKKIPLETFQKRLQVDVAAAASTNEKWSEIMDYTTGKRVAKIRIDDRVFSGREVREALNLNSAAFSLEIKDGTVVVTTKGYGHGVGMSQWGANGMAKEGYKASQIVRHYYQGVRIEDYHQWVKR